MTNPLGTAPAPVVVANHTSAHWGPAPGPAQAQQTPSWCFAAAEHIVQAAFGVAISQDEIAHNVLMARGAIQDNANNAVTYFNGVQNLWATNGLADASWASVGALVMGDQTLNGYRRAAWGTPPLTGRTSQSGGALTEDEIVATLNVDGLVLAGSAAHWTVIHGYVCYSNGAVSFTVYDPMTNTVATLPSANVIANMSVSYRVTG